MKENYLLETEVLMLKHFYGINHQTIAEIDSFSFTLEERKLILRLMEKAYEKATKEK